MGGGAKGRMTGVSARPAPSLSPAAACSGPPSGARPPGCASRGPLLRGPLKPLSGRGAAQGGRTALLPLPGSPPHLLVEDHRGVPEEGLGA